MDYDLQNLLDSIKIPQIDEIPNILFPPIQLSPLNYAGIGNVLYEESDISPRVLRYEKSKDTMMIEPIRNLITGEIESYRDIPIAAVSTDDSSINRPISNIDDYHKGSNTGVAFTPGGFTEEKSPELEHINDYLQSLDSGVNLLYTPCSNAKSDHVPDILPSIVDLPTIEPSPVPQARTQIITEELKSYAIVDNWDTKLFSQEIPNPAMTFPFELDQFQMRAIHRLELNQAVFVSAPTSAGKTAIAQYSIALCRSHKMRVLYTSPIKALSNQKFRDLTKQFGDVGILTGDVSINREASCLIMTTEILRSMLYHGADILRDVECVVFDECHFISNDERGVVWEESIILLPFHINMVFLSATVPNAMEIADWIGRTKQRMVYVQNHYSRPVPLEHVLYIGNGQYFQIARPRGQLDALKVYDARNSLQTTEERIDYSVTFWVDFISSIFERNLSPILIFCFSQRMCEDLAYIIRPIELITGQERKHVIGFCNKALSRLRKEDRDLPQIRTVFSLLEHGIGIHHGGILPIVKEIVEILLCDGYVKVLFCTSTFSMGINVPARSCAFVSLDMYNGKEFAKILPSDYVQMSGRAGRRGLDTVGTSIIMCHGAVPEVDYLKTLISGKVQALKSQFKLKFNMILNLMRVRDIKMIDLLRRSLSANLIQSMMPDLLKNLTEIEKELKNLPQIDCVLRDIEDMSSFGYCLNEVYSINQYLLDQVDSSSLMKQLMKGRVVYVLNDRPSLVFVQDKIGNTRANGLTSSGEMIEFDVKDVAAIFTKPSKTQERMKSDEIKTFLLNFKEKPIHYTKLLSTSEYEFAQYSTEQIRLYEIISSSPCFHCSLLQDHLEIYNRKVTLAEEKANIQKQMHDESLAFKPILDAHINFLMALGYIDSEHVIQLKGRVAIEISYVDEILGTEMLFSNIFEDLSPEECAGLVSCLCCEGIRSEEPLSLPMNLPETYIILEDLAQRIEKLMDEYQIPSAYFYAGRNVNAFLASVLYDWAQGKSFNQVISTTEIPEGTVVKIISRVAETLKDFSNAAKLVGCISLSEKFDLAIQMIKRDIIFASSLYFE